MKGIVFCTFFVFSLAMNEGQQISYDVFVKALNWRDYPVAPLSSPPTMIDKNWQGTDQQNALTSVNFNNFIQNLGN